MKKEMLEIINEVAKSRPSLIMQIKIGNVAIRLRTRRTRPRRTTTLESAHDTGEISVGSYMLKLPISLEKLKQILKGEEETVDINHDVDYTYRIPIRILPDIAKCKNVTQVYDLIKRYALVDVSSENADLYFDTDESSLADLKSTIKESYYNSP